MEGVSIFVHIEQGAVKYFMTTPGYLYFTIIFICIPHELMYSPGKVVVEFMTRMYVRSFWLDVYNFSGTNLGQPKNIVLLT